MLSRVADTIYWMARYTERTDGMLQALRTNYIAMQDGVKNFCWQPMLSTYGDLSPEEISCIQHDSSKVLEHLILDKMNAASVFNNITQGRENARAIQDHITKEVWQCLNDYYHLIRHAEIEKQMKAGDPVSAIDLLMRQGLLLTGTIKNTMSRNEGYTFLHLGKFLERAIQTADILRIKLAELNYVLDQANDAPALRYLLYSLWGYEVYIKSFKGNVNADDVLELVLYNTYFPHSLIYSLYQIHKYFERLKPESLPENYEKLEFLIGKTMNNVKYSKLSANNPVMINNFLLQTRNELIEIGSSFGKYYFGNS
jgi:uncharacterized alpha-E superfamily protein